MQYGGDNEGLTHGRRLQLNPYFPDQAAAHTRTHTVGRMAQRAPAMSLSTHSIGSQLHALYTQSTEPAKRKRSGTEKKKFSNKK